jgi:hypothetical protein
MGNLVFEPLIPTALWVVLAVVAMVLLALYAWNSRHRIARSRWGLMIGLMFVALLLPLGILLNPQWVERIPPPAGKPLLTILVDSSRSMETPDGRAGDRRLDEARKIAESVSKNASADLEVEVRTFTASSGPADLQKLKQSPAEGQFTDLGAAIRDALQPDRPQGQALLLLSDGVHNVGPVSQVLESASRAKAMSVPIFAKTIGGAATVRDVTVEAVTPQELAFVGQRIPVRIRVTAQDLAGDAEVVLKSGDKEVDRRKVTLIPGQTPEVQFEVSHNESGVYRYDVSVTGFPQEVTLVNNNCTQVLRVVAEPIRVLLLEGKPYWDTKFLIRTLAADQAIELVSLVRMAEGRFLERTLRRPPITPAAAGTASVEGTEVAQVTDGAVAKEPDAASDSATTTASNDPAKQSDPQPAAPAIERSEDWKIRSDGASVLNNPKNLDSYQVIVLGRDAETFLSPTALLQLRRWLIVSGGSLLCFRGPPTVQANQQLAQLLPVRWTAGRESRFRMRLTETGEAMHWLPEADDGSSGESLARLPTLARSSQAGDMQPLTQVLAVADLPTGETTSPVVSFRPFASGRVVLVEGAGMWRWAFLSPEHKQYDPVYGALWHSLVRWLVSNTGLLSTQNRALRSDKIRFNTTEQATGSLLVRESALTETLPSVELRSDQLPAVQTFTPIPSGDESGAFRVVFGKLPEGRYEARLAGSEASESAARTIFDVRGNMTEVLELSANEPLLKRLTDITGGSLITGDSIDQVSTQIDRQLSRSRPEQIRTTTAWDRKWVMITVLGLWVLSWAVRRSGGLI